MNNFEKQYSNYIEYNLPNNFEENVINKVKLNLLEKQILKSQNSLYLKRTIFLVSFLILLLICFYIFDFQNLIISINNKKIFNFWFFGIAIIGFYALETNRKYYLTNKKIINL